MRNPCWGEASQRGALSGMRRPAPPRKLSGGVNSESESGLTSRPSFIFQIANLFVREKFRRALRQHVTLRALAERRETCGGGGGENDMENEWGEGVCNEGGVATEEAT